MEKANATKDKYIRLSDLFYAVWDRLIILIIIGAVAAVGAFGLQYIKGQRIAGEEPSHITYLEIYMGPKANISSGATYSELFLSDKIIGDVIEAEDIDLTVEEVRSYLFTEEKEAALFRLVILSPEQELTDKIAGGMSTVGLDEVVDTIDGSQMTVIQYPVKAVPVKSDVRKVQSAYRSMVVQVFPEDLVIPWDAYYSSFTSKTNMIKKAVFVGVAAAAAAAICFIIMAIFKRRLRYPEDIEYVSDLKVILTVDKKKQGTSALASRLLDICGDEKTFLFIGAKDGDGTTTMAKAAAEGINALGEKVMYFDTSAIRESMIDSSKGYIIADGGAVESSYQGISKSKNYDCTVLVIEEDSVDDIQLNRMKSVLTDAGANIIGIILNKAKVNRLGRRSRYFGTYYEEN